MHREMRRVARLLSLAKDWPDLALLSKTLLGQLARYGLSTLFSASLSFGLPVLLREVFGLESWLAVAIGFAIAYVGNLLLLKLFVYRSKGGWGGDTARYVVTNGAFRLAEYGAYLALERLAGLDYRIAVLIVLAVSAVLKFFAYRYVFVGEKRGAAA